VRPRLRLPCLGGFLAIPAAFIGGAAGVPVSY